MKSLNKLLTDSKQNYSNAMHTSHLPLGQGLQCIVLKANLLLQMDGMLQHVLQPELAVHCRVANFYRGRLVVHVDSAVWVTQLRFEQNNLLYALQRLDLFGGLQKIEWKVTATLHHTF